MENLHTISRFSNTINSIYQASLDSEYWPEVLKSLCEEIGANKAVMLYMSPCDHKFSFTCGYGFNPYKYGVGARHFRRQIPNDPVAAYGLANLNEVFSDRLALGEQVITSSAIHKELKQPFDMEYSLAVFLTDESQELTGLCFFRGKNEKQFTKEDEQWLEQYKQHINNAANIHKVISGRSRLNSLQTALVNDLKNGLIIVDEDHTVILKNTAADGIIDDYGVLEIRNGRLRCKNNKENIVLNHAIDRSLFEKDLHHFRFGVKMRSERFDTEIFAISSRLICSSLQENTSGPTEQDVKAYYSASIPHKKYALITLCDTQSGENLPTTLLQNMFELTSAEADLALCLLEGYTLSEAAQTLGRAKGTAKVQLNSIFKKTDTSRQADLIKLLMSIA